MSADNLRAARARQADAMAARREDFLWMASTGECLEGAARRLGIKPDSLIEWCKDNGLHAEAELMRSRDPLNTAAVLSERGKAGASARWAS
jgi:hypothetical protein